MEKTKSRLNPQLRFPHFAGECDGTKRWYQTSSTSTRENQRKPTQQTPRQRSESQDFQTLNLWHRPDMHAMTGVSRCGIAPGRRKRKQGNIKPRLTHSAALPTLSLRENVMELNVDTKRLPPAQETTWTRELKQNNWYAPQVQIVEFYNWLNAAIVEKRPIRSDQYSKNTNQN